MKARLISRKHGEFLFGEQATIGRAEGSTVTIDATVVSNEHARISFDAQRSAYALEDLGSLNGTRLDGVAVERKEFLGKLNLIRFGGSEDFIFQLLDTKDSTELDTIAVAAEKTQVGAEVPVLPAALRDEASAASPSEAVGSGTDPDSPPAGGTQIEKNAVPLPEILAQASAGVRPAGGGPRLALEFVLEDGPRRFPLRAGENVVGRSKTANIRLDFGDLSRRHATLTVSEGKILARDDGSRNHTFLDGEKIETETEVPLGAPITFGRLEARVVEMPAGDSDRNSAGAGQEPEETEPNE